MSGWIYLIRNRDIFKIGITKNFENRMRQLKPDSIVAKLYCSDFLLLEKEFHKRYKNFRIPQTEYFRLEKCHVNEIKQRLSMLEYPLRIYLLMFVKSLFTLLLIFLIILLLNSLFINDVVIVLQKSMLWIERITIAYAYLSLLLHSGKYLNSFSELKYRLFRFICFFLLSYCFRMIYVFVQ